jgi:hypothetical protein
MHDHNHPLETANSDKFSHNGTNMAISIACRQARLGLAGEVVLDAKSRPGYTEKNYPYCPSDSSDNELVCGSLERCCFTRNPSFLL